MSYVRASKELPFLSDEEIAEKAREYDMHSSDDEAGQMKEHKLDEKDDAAERYSDENAKMA